MSVYIDIHTHSAGQTPRTGDTISIVSLFPDRTDTLPPRCSVGVHPWHAAREDVEAMLKRLRSLLSKPEVTAIGECGLDRAVDVPWEAQMHVFHVQVELSEEFKLPLLIHSVRAHSDLTAMRKQFQATLPWIVHGFTGGAATAGQLVRAGCRISFGEAIVRADSKAALSCAAIPDEYLFLETDVSNIAIEEIYAAAAALRSCSVQELQRRVGKNFESCFREREH